MLIRTLAAVGYAPTLLLEQENVGRLATVRLIEGEDSIVSDLLFASSGLESEIVGAAEVLEMLPAVYAPVAGLSHLIALKLLARDDETRPQDIDDLRALLKVASSTDIDQARIAIDLITSRGFNRDRDLMHAFDSLMRGSA